MIVAVVVVAVVAVVVAAAEASLEQRKFQKLNFPLKNCNHN